jgi:hypothetical protein
MRGFALTRRWLLGLSALLPFSRSGTLFAGVGKPGGSGVPPALARLLPAPADAAVIGRTYLASAPDEGDLAKLVHHFLAMADGTGDLRTAIGSRLRRDFDERQTVRVRGWVLSHTEARLYALSALLMDEHRPTGARMA